MKSLATIIIISISIPNLYSVDLPDENMGNSFKKVMAKNRSRKNIDNSNYVEIKNKDDLKKHGDKPIGLDVKSKTGPVYNYVEIKNVKSSKNKFKKSTRTYGIEKFKKDDSDKPLYGVKVKKGFKGKINNTVNIKNSTLE